MDTNSIYLEENPKDKRRASVFAFAYGIILVLFVIYPFWSYPFPPPGQSGILVSFGSMEESGIEEVYNTQDESENKTEDEGNNSESTTKASSQNNTELKRSENSSPLISRSISDLPSSLEATQEVKKSAQNEMVQSNQNQQKSGAKNPEEDFQKAKQRFGEIIGRGKGNSANSSNAGDPKGDPDVSSLEGISKGKGNIGGGLAERGVLFEPEIEENSQKSGKVVVRVCVDQRGKVVESKYTQRGSTTTDSDLVRAAIEGSKRYSFAKSPIEKQCGTITIDFKLK